jgi:hypothetical protein
MYCMTKIFLSVQLSDGVFRIEAEENLSKEERFDKIN